MAGIVNKYNHVNMCIMKCLLKLSVFVLVLAGCASNVGEHWQMKGVVLHVDDLNTMDWPEFAHRHGINTIGTHMHPGQVIEFIQSEKGQEFLANCRKYGIDVEHQVHAMSELLPRELFKDDPEMFRMNELGERTDDFNCCAHSEKALDIISAKAREFAALLPSDNHRYYFWLDDGKETCYCPKCKEYSVSEQALIIENRMIEGIKKVDPKAKLAHLCYSNALSAPVKVKPAEGVFLEFAPIDRNWERPLSDKDAPAFQGNLNLTNGDILRYLEDNLKVFSAEDAVILEYWLDVSLFSRWTKPAVQLPWNKASFESDVDTYAGYGLRNVTSFAVYMDSTYFNRFPDTSCLNEYTSKLSSEL